MSNSIIEARENYMECMGFQHMRDEIWFKQIDRQTISFDSAQELLENKLRVEAGLNRFNGHTDQSKYHVLYAIVDYNGFEMPGHASGRRRLYHEAVAMVNRLNGNGEYKPYMMVPKFKKCRITPDTTL